MAVTKMGFEGLVYRGSAGSTASTQITNIRDVNYNIDRGDGDTTVKGDGSAVPIGCARAVRLDVTIDFLMLNKSDDTSLEALRTAAAAGTPVALRLKDYSSGKGFDGDVLLSVQHGEPIGGEQTYQFTATPNNDNRTPQLYV